MPRWLGGCERQNGWPVLVMCMVGRKDVCENTTMSERERHVMCLVRPGPDIHNAEAAIRRASSLTRQRNRHETRPSQINNCPNGSSGYDHDVGWQKLDH